MSGPSLRERLNRLCAEVAEMGDVIVGLWDVFRRQHLRNELDAMNAATASLQASIDGLRDEVKECRALIAQTASGAENAQSQWDEFEAVCAQVGKYSGLFANFPTGTFMNKPPSDGLSDHKA